MKIYQKLAGHVWSYRDAIDNKRENIAEVHESAIRAILHDRFSGYEGLSVDLDKSHHNLIIFDFYQKVEGRRIPRKLYLVPDLITNFCIKRVTGRIRVAKAGINVHFHRVLNEDIC